MRSTETYGELPARLEQEFGSRVEHVHLGKYVSFDDSVTLDDLSTALEAAITEKRLRGFTAITHSTGGPLLRHWLKRRAAAPRLLKRLIMLAPANHGSALAQLGKGRLARMKAFLDGVEPGQKILDWLELGSEEQWALNREWMDYEAVEQGIFPFVLSGDSVDPKLYDHLNSYTGEAGGDGVVRLAAANLNYEYVQLAQVANGRLEPVAWHRSPRTAFRVVPGVAHGGARIGIMRSVALSGSHPTLEAIAEALAVEDATQYHALTESWAARNQSAAPHSMLIFRVRDKRGHFLDDYDILLTAGPEESPDALPKGFFRDRQRNRLHPGKLTYFLDHSKLRDTPIGFEVHARPVHGLVSYQPGRLAPTRLEGILRPDETLMVDIVLERVVDRACFQLTENQRPERISADPLGPVRLQAA